MLLPFFRAFTSLFLPGSHTSAQSSMIVSSKSLPCLKVKFYQFLMPCKRFYMTFASECFFENPNRQPILTRQLDPSSPEIQNITLPPSVLPQSQTCDNLLHRIRDLFSLPRTQPAADSSDPQSSKDAAPSSAAFPSHSAAHAGTLARYTIARVICSDEHTESVFLRDSPTSEESSDLNLLWESGLSVSKSLFAIAPEMIVRVVRLNAPGELNHAFVRVCSDQECFPECQGQEGFVESKYLDILPALPPCNSAAVCLMRCVQRVALRVRAVCILVFLPPQPYSECHAGTCFRIC